MQHQHAVTVGGGGKRRAGGGGAGSDGSGIGGPGGGGGSASRTAPSTTATATPSGAPTVDFASIKPGTAGNLFGYDPELPVLNGDPRLNPGLGLGVNWHPSQPVRNEWEDWGNTAARTFNISTQSFQQSPAELMQDMLTAVQLAAMVGAQQSVSTALKRGGANADHRVVAAAAAAAASRMAPMMLELVQARRNSPTPVPQVKICLNGKDAAAPAAGAGTKAGAPATKAAGASGTDAKKVANAEERRLARLARNRNASMKARQRHKHRVTCMETELERVLGRRRALLTHRWGEDTPAPAEESEAGKKPKKRGKQGRARANSAAHRGRSGVLQNSADVLHKGLTRIGKPYSPDGDNYAEFIVARAKYRRNIAESPQTRVELMAQSLSVLRCSTMCMQAAVFGHMSLLWACESVCQCTEETRRCVTNGTCDARTYRLFKTRRSETANEVRKVLGGLSPAAANQLLRSRDGVKTSMAWLQKLSQVLSRFEALLHRGLAASHRLSQVLAGILTAQQIEKLGVWWTENERRVRPPGIPACAGGAAHSHCCTLEDVEAAHKDICKGAPPCHKSHATTTLASSTLASSAAGVVWPAAVGGARSPFAGAAYQTAYSPVAHARAHGHGHGHGHGSARTHTHQPSASVGSVAGAAAGMHGAWEGASAGGVAPAQVPGTHVDQLRLRLHHSREELRNLQEEIERQSLTMGAGVGHLGAGGLAHLSVGVNAASPTPVVAQGPAPKRQRRHD